MTVLENVEEPEMSELWQWDAVSIADAVRTGRVSSRDVVRSCLDRVEQFNPSLNAIIDYRPEEALQAADEADAAVRRGDELGLLHGVPVTTKVNVDQRGYPTTNGIVSLANKIAADDSPVVKNLRHAGAIFLGRTNTPSFSFRWFTDNDLHGETLNPRNMALTPGGSSGGAAAAVASGMGPLAQGNDIGGSVRYPAYACGIVGLRPTFGRVPSFNGTSVEERPLSSQMMLVQGPLARRVRDLRLGLAAMSNGDARDPWWTPAPLAGGAPPRPIRVALSVDPFGHGVDPLVVEALGNAASHLRAAGYLVEEAELPRMQDAAALWSIITMNEARRSFAKVGLELGGKAFQNAFRGMLVQTPQIDLEAYQQAFQDRATILREWILFLERYPLVLLPVSMERPFELGLDQEGDAAMARIMKAQQPLFPFAVLGLPSVSVPTGISNGIPIGVQLAANRFREDLCLDAAECIEAQAPIAMPATVA
jgi:amidase